jgi:hypothetical protein
MLGVGSTLKSVNHVSRIKCKVCVENGPIIIRAKGNESVTYVMIKICNLCLATHRLGRARATAKGNKKAKGGPSKLSEMRLVGATDKD